jgi:hypothetical protein
MLSGLGSGGVFLALTYMTLGLIPNRARDNRRGSQKL